MDLGMPPPSEAVTWASSIAVGAVAFAFSIQKILKIWADGTTGINTSNGENQVVTLLRDELERTDKKNKELDAKVVQLIALVESLRDQNAVLEASVYQMKREIANITTPKI